MNQTQAQIMDPVTSEIDWVNKLNKYKNVFALSTEEFKKFAVIQNDKVSGNDKEIVQLLKTNANIVLVVTTKQKEVTNEVLIKRECGCQDYGIQELINKIPNLETKEQKNSEGLEIKVEEFKQGCSGSRDQALKTTRNISYKKKGKVKQLEEQQENKKRNSAGTACAIAPKGAPVVSKKKLEKEVEEKRELIDPKDKEDLKTIQELYETDLNIQLGTIDKDINKEDLTKLCKE
ncbi:39820_t:CDS:2 [Gigaspora margarita]|uniref:39820_t:CDS:1 n=1 Tax=Gigaspora margarita TaxID=4874 RepID=A0ABN7W0N2_GIGMA|nr:39820_t:CDS:2 [Gigaspora margarita]